MVPGPENFAHWQASFKVMRTAFIMTEIITLNNLMQWESMIERMNRQFPSCWGLVAAADDRARGEYMSKTLAKMKMEFSQGTTPPIGWVEDQPWNHVWLRVLKDRDYWNDQFYVPAMTWTARGAKGTPLTPMEEEANISLRGGHRALQVETEDNLVNKEGEGKRGHNRARREAKKRRLAAEREELKSLRSGNGKGGKGGGSKDGTKGKGGSGAAKEEECFAWNNGNGLCGGLLPGEPCQARIKRIHRCTICKSTNHPSRECPQGAKKS